MFLDNRMQQSFEDMPEKVLLCGIIKDLNLNDLKIDLVRFTASKFLIQIPKIVLLHQKFLIWI